MVCAEPPEGAVVEDFPFGGTYEILGEMSDGVGTFPARTAPFFPSETPLVFQKTRDLTPGHDRYILKALPTPPGPCGCPDPGYSRDCQCAAQKSGVYDGSRCTCTCHDAVEGHLP